MSKCKSSGDRRGELISLELDEEQIAVLELIPDLLHPSLKCLVPVLDSIRKAYSDAIPAQTRALPVNISILYNYESILTMQQTRQATDFKHTTAAAISLGIDYKEDDISYIFNLEAEHLQESGQLSANIGKCAYGILRIFLELTSISLYSQRS